MAYNAVTDKPESSQKSSSAWRGTLSGLCASLVGIGLVRFGYTPLLPAIIGAHWFTASAAAYLGAANLVGLSIPIKVLGAGAAMLRGHCNPSSSITPTRACQSRIEVPGRNCRTVSRWLVARPRNGSIFPLDLCEEVIQIGKVNAAIAASNECNFSFELAHIFLLTCNFISH